MRIPSAHDKISKVSPIATRTLGSARGSSQATLHQQASIQKLPTIHAIDDSIDTNDERANEPRTELGLREETISPTAKDIKIGSRLNIESEIRSKEQS